jgi:DNA invertase Pin-like site-specific DNA recombinase
MTAAIGYARVGTQKQAASGLEGKDMPGIIAYYRVSTAKQGASGLGLEAQQMAVRAYAQRIGARVLAGYTEVETGKRSDRPELAKALAHSRRSKATLCVGKLDRLSRNVAFLAAVMDSGAEFAACDLPQASRLMLHIMAAVAEAEALAISQRTAAALAAYKARGGKLGASLEQCNTLTQKARVKGARNAAVVRQQKAREAYVDLLPSMKTWREEGLTLDAIAAKLNADGHTTRRGRPWAAGHVFSVLKRAG